MDLKRSSLDELNNEAVGDCQLAISFASFSALRVSAASNCCRCAASLFARDLTGWFTSRAGNVASVPLLFGSGWRFAAATVANAEYVCGRGEYFDQMANVAAAKITKASADAKAKVKVRRGCFARDCARCQVAEKLGETCSSTKRVSLYSALSFLSSPIISITHFHLREVFTHALLASLVVLTHAADRNTHHVRGLAQTQIFVKNQVQSFALPSRQILERALKMILKFGAL